MAVVDLDTFKLGHGSHKSLAEGACIMELASYLAHQRWSDRPPCVSPAIGAFLRSWNDSLSDPPRTELLMPFVEKILNTNTSPEDEQTRAWLACDWLVRTFTVAWLRTAGLTKDADALAGLPALTSTELANAAMPAIKKAKRSAAAAWDAARAAAGAAAWDAARDAAQAAAQAAAGAAARDAAQAAAQAAAGAAVWDAAWDAVWAAVWDAAWDALNDTVTELQLSACELLDRLIAVGRN